MILFQFYFSFLLLPFHTIPFSTAFIHHDRSKRFLGMLPDLIHGKSKQLTNLKQSNNNMNIQIKLAQDQIMQEALMLHGTLDSRHTEKMISMRENDNVHRVASMGDSGIARISSSTKISIVKVATSAHVSLMKVVASITKSLGRINAETLKISTKSESEELDKDDYETMENLLDKEVSEKIDNEIKRNKKKKLHKLDQMEKVALDKSFEENKLRNISLIQENIAELEKEHAQLNKD
ncbi:hypothetical protein SNEBB_005541 [Seison nebaliae]|nr:hypothetical protein SNEBB_005541 [Seison nebaliae]